MPESFGRERKRIRLEKRPCRDPIPRLRWRGIKRPFCVMESPQEMPSKGMRISTDEKMKNIETLHTSAVDPPPLVRVKMRRWKPFYLKLSPIIEEEVTETEKVLLKKIWIIGSSYIHCGERAAYECFGENFGLNAKVEWFGKGGLRWSGVFGFTESCPPDILVIRASGNDLGHSPANQLAATMRGLMQLNQEFPSTIILFFCINEWQAWRYGHPKIINGDRKTVNVLMTKAVHRFGGEVIQHPLLSFFNKKNLIYLTKFTSPRKETVCLTESLRRCSSKKTHLVSPCEKVVECELMYVEVAGRAPSETPAESDGAITVCNLELMTQQSQ